jgi:hypothetical protein
LHSSCCTTAARRWICPRPTGRSSACWPPGRASFTSSAFR